MCRCDIFTERVETSATTEASESPPSTAACSEEPLRRLQRRGLPRSPARHSRPPRHHPHLACSSYRPSPRTLASVEGNSTSPHTRPCRAAGRSSEALISTAAGTLPSLVQDEHRPSPTPPVTGPRLSSTHALGCAASFSPNCKPVGGPSSDTAAGNHGAILSVDAAGQRSDHTPQRCRVRRLTDSRRVQRTRT